MNEEFVLEQKINAGFEALRFLQEPQFLQAVEYMESSLYTAWRQSLVGEHEKRELIWHQQHALDELRKTLTFPVDEGTFAAAEKSQADYSRRLE